MMGLGIAIDYTSASNVRSSLQQALDAAVLAGARETDDAKKAAAASTFFQTEVATKLETGQMTAQADFGVESDGTVTGSARVHLPTNFTHLMGVKHLPVTAKAAAIAAGTASKVCVLLVNPSKSQALLLNSGAVVNAPDCEFHVRSTANPAAVFNGGTTLNVKTACIKGTQIIKNGGANPPAQTGCNAVTDPLAGKLPAVSAGSCDYNNQTYNPGNVSLNPGTYCGWTNFNGSGNLTLKPGLYVIKDGGMTFNSSWTVTGTGVTFYLANQNSTLTFNGNVNAKLSAPTSGTYANILMFEPTGLGNTNLPINGTSGSSLEGLLYLPSRDVTINSVSNVSSRKLTMVFSTLILNAVNWTFEPGTISIGAQGATPQSVRLLW